jgi:hypothetical protein
MNFRMQTPAGFTSLIGQFIQDASGLPLASGSLIVTPTDANDYEIAAVAGGAGGAIAQTTFPIANGQVGPTGLLDSSQNWAGAYVSNAIYNVGDVVGYTPSGGTLGYYVNSVVGNNAAPNGSGWALLPNARGPWLADTALTRPTNISYRFVTQDSTGAQVSPAMKGVQFASTPTASYNIDTATPPGSAQAPYIQGPSGLTAYQIYQQNGGALSQTAWLNSLVGTQGAAGTASVVTSNGANGNFAVTGAASAQNLALASSVAVPANATTATFVEPRGVSVETSTFGSGWSVGNVPGQGGWTSWKGYALDHANAVRGIKQTNYFTLNNWAVGDTAGIYGYVNSTGGITAASDEGVTGINIEVQEWPSHFKGTIQSTTGIGDTQPVLTNFVNRNFTADGGVLMNISKGTISGNMTGLSVPVNTDATVGASGSTQTYLRAIPTNATLPLTTAWGYVAPGPDGYALDATGLPMDNSVSTTLTVTLLPIPGQTGLPPFAVGDPVLIAGESNCEQAQILAIQPPSNGIQSITLTRHYPQISLYIFRGGIAGQFISFDANLAFSGLRSSYNAVGSFDGSHLIYQTNNNGELGTQLPIAGAEAAKADGGPSSGFHLYPGAEVVGNRTVYDANCTLEFNTVAWAAGDSVECAHPKFFGGHGAWFTKSQYSPTVSSFGSPVFEVSMQGTGIGAGTNFLVVTNGNPDSFYNTSGGPLYRPVMAQITGSFDRAFSFLNAPNDVIVITNPPTVIAAATAGSNQITYTGFAPNIGVNDVFRFDGVLPAGTIITAIAGQVLTLSNAATQTVPHGNAYLKQAIYADAFGTFITSLPTGVIHIGQLQPDYLFANHISMTGGIFDADDNTYFTVSDFTLRASGNGSNVPTRNPKDNGPSIANTQYVDAAVAAAVQGVNASLQVTTPTGTKTLTITNGLITGLA